MQYLYTAVFTPFADGSGYEACIPDIPHCVTSGHDLPDALRMVADAASLMLVDMEDDHLPTPQATPPQQFRAPEGSITSLVCLDTDQYRRINDARAVRKNVSIPAWMNRLVEQNGINCSQILQEALRSRFQQ